MESVQMNTEQHVLSSVTSLIDEPKQRDSD